MNVFIQINIVSTGLLQVTLANQMKRGIDPEERLANIFNKVIHKQQLCYDLS